MNTERRRALEPLFAPRSVAVLGATDDLDRAGGRLMRHVTAYGYEGRVYPVHPTRTEVAGRPCFPSLTDVPEAVDLVLLGLGASRVADAIREAGRCRAKVAVIFASGFAEAGGPGAELQRELLESWRGSTLRILGPNTAGVRATHLGLFAEQGRTLESEGFTGGTVAMISQSGGLGAYFASTYLQPLGVGTRYFVDTGNELDIDAAEVLDHIASDPAVSVIALLLEGARDGRKLAEAVRGAVDVGKPVVFLKVGRTAAGMDAARSHTAAMASQAELLEAELAAAGAFVTRDDRQLADAMLLHSVGAVPRGRRLGIITPSGGFGILALDLASDLGLEVPQISGESVQLSAGAEPRPLANPLDIPVHLSNPGTAALEATLRSMGQQANVDAVILWHPHRFVDAQQQELNLPVLRRCRELIGKPVFHCGMTSPQFRIDLQAIGVVSFEAPSRLMRAIAAVALPGHARARPIRGRAAATSAAGTVMPGEQARSVLAGWGIRSSPTVVVADVGQAVALAREWESLIMLKLESARATHKTEEGLVRGPLGGAEIPAAFEDLSRASARLADPEATLVAQPFERGIELALGAYVDAAFGPSVMVAHGGIFVEVLDDAAFAAAPIDPKRARALVESLRIYPALAGSRGQPADVPAVVAALVGLSRFIAKEAAQGLSVDINPLIVRELGAGAVAVDARIVTAGPRTS